MLAYIDTRSNSDYPITAVMEHEGVQYTQKFRNRGSVKKHLIKTGDQFLSLTCIVYNAVVRGNKELQAYFELPVKRMSKGKRPTITKPSAPSDNKPKRYRVAT